MRISKLFTGLLLGCFAGVASADLEPWTDYDIGERVSNVTTVKVDSNMIDKYLEGLKSSWVPANEILKEQAAQARERSRAWRARPATRAG